MLTASGKTGRGGIKDLAPAGRIFSEFLENTDQAKESECMETIMWGSRLPKEKKYLVRLLARAEQVMERWKTHPLLTETAREQAAQLLARRMEILTGSTLQSMWEQRMQERNPLLSWDIRLATQEEKTEAAQVLLAELEQSGDRVLLERWPLLRDELERCVERFSRWLQELLDRVERHRGDISGVLFDGEDFGRITSLITDQADLHFHGRSAAVVHTDKGPFLYKPHDCGVDAFYCRLVDRWFSDITHAPRVVTGEGYGFCEFIAGKPASSQEDLAAYFTNFGGLCALFQALGSTDLHYENFIAQGRYPVLVDLETLFTPTPRVFHNPDVFPEPPPQREDFAADLSRSLCPSCVLPYMVDDIQMSPLLASALPTLWGFEENFFAGFSQIYDRCIELRDQLAAFLQEAEAFPVRKLIRQSTYYARLLRRYYSPAAWDSPEIRKNLLARPSVFFQRRGREHLQSIADWEVVCLREGDIPYFSCRMDGVDLLGYGQVVAEDFFRQSPLDSARERLARMGPREKQFELTLIRQSLETALIPVPKEERIPLPAVEEVEHPLSKAEALAQAEELFRLLRDRAVTSPSGEVSWLMKSADQKNISNARPELHQGTAGLGIFFAGLYRATDHAGLKSQAKELCRVVLDQIRSYLEALEKAQKIPEDMLPLGLSSGVAGVLKSLAIMGRCSGEEETGQLIDRMLSLLNKVQIAESKQLDVLSGAAGLLQVLCGYGEIRSRPLASRLIEDCAGKLLAAKTLKTKSGKLLWDTLNLGRPISGMGHGVSGIGASLQMAGTFLRRKEYLLSAREALDWEYQIYSEKLGTWPDFRENSLGEQFMHGYCSGAPGIGLAMLLYGEWGETGPLQQQNLARAITACQTFPLQPRDHICCGNSASIDFLLEAGRRQGWEESVQAAGRRLAHIVARKDQLGHFCYLPPSYRDHLEISLFYGAAGVGYELLRWAEESLPSVLL